MSADRKTPSQLKIGLLADFNTQNLAAILRHPPPSGDGFEGRRLRGMAQEVWEFNEDHWPIVRRSTPTAMSRRIGRC